jgi:Uma2 family endonuclease
MEVLERRAKSYHENVHDNVIRKGKTTKQEVTYPDSDGKPMAENTLQFEWIVKVKENLEIMYKNQPDVFVAGDLLWYAVEGNNKIRMAPDAMVVFGRPKGYRGSYMIWKEDNIAPQVVFEILSPGNTPKEMTKKFRFYDKHGVEEYYLYDPDKIALKGWIRLGNDLTEIEDMNGWTSPRLKIRFETTDTDLYIYYPDGRKFLSTVELDDRTEAQRQRAELADQQAETERQQAEAQRQKAEAQRQRADRLAAKLRELGIEPDL